MSLLSYISCIISVILLMPKLSKADHIYSNSIWLLLLCSCSSCPVLVLSQILIYQILSYFCIVQVSFAVDEFSNIFVSLFKMIFSFSTMSVLLILCIVLMILFFVLLFLLCFIYDAHSYYFYILFIRTVVFCLLAFTNFCA